MVMVICIGIVEQERDSEIVTCRRRRRRSSDVITRVEKRGWRWVN
jgi:hypothetical protein